jgi:septal ring factor EnvC (AmiA/AmiB activator)
MKRFLNIIVIMVISGMIAASGMLAAHVAQAQKPADIERGLQQFEAAKKQKKALDKAVRKAEQSLKSIRINATKIARDVQKNESVLMRAERDLRRASIKRDAALKQLHENADAYRASILAILRLRKLPASMVFSPAEKREQLRLTVSALTVLQGTLSKQLSALQKSHIRLDQAQKKSAKARDVMADKKHALAKEYGALQRSLLLRQRQYKQLKIRDAKLKQEVETLAKNAKDLQDLLFKLDANKRAKLSRHLSLRPITRAKGSLRQAVAGRITHQFGQKKNANEKYRGMVLRSRQGATVVAPYDGEVAYSGTFREYGDMLLIRHTGGYMSLLAGLGTRNVVVGTKLRAGEPVGKMGAEPAKLYIELRKNRKPIDPASWYAKL